MDELFVQTEGEYDIDFFARKSEVENSRVVQGCMRGINRSINQSLIVEQWHVSEAFKLYIPWTVHTSNSTMFLFLTVILTDILEVSILQHNDQRWQSIV